MRAHSKWMVAGLGSLALLTITACGGHPHHHHGDKEYIFKKMDRQVEKLNLTPEQRGEYEKLRHELDVSMDDRLSSLRSLVKETEGELNKENPDMDLLARNIKAQMARRPEEWNKRIDSFLKFYNMLDEKQKAKVVADLRDKAGKLSRHIR